MSEILTESFCERCGTRYTFESASPKGARLKGLRTVSRGLKNFVMSDDTSIDEAMAAARNETDREVTSQQLDAFHKTFNFCMSCRQYTCGNCWNEPEGRCLSCAPHLGHEILSSPFPNLESARGLPFGRAEAAFDDLNGHEAPEPAPAEPMAWPTSDLMREEEQAAISFETVLAEHEVEETEGLDALARLEALESAVEPEPVAPPEPIAAEPEPEPEPVAAVPEPAPIAAAIPEPEPEPEPVATAAPEPEPIPAAPEPVVTEPEPELDDRAAAASTQTADLFRRFSAGQNLDEAIAAYERAQAAADALAPAETEEPAAPQHAAPQPAAPQAAAPQASAPQPEPTPIQAAPEPEIAAEPEPIAAAPVGPAPAPAPEPVPLTRQQPAPEPEPEPVAAVAPPQPEWPSAPELDRAAATAWPQSEPEPFAPAPEPFPEPVAAEPRDDLVLQPTWQVVAPDNPPEPQWPAQPEWPPQPEWPAQRQADGIPFLGRPAQPSGGIEALWAESAREVANAAGVATAPGVGLEARPSGGVQPCVSCGLSLSANARFCRRCGSRQG